VACGIGGTDLVGEANRFLVDQAFRIGKPSATPEVEQEKVEQEKVEQETE
jgi:hypothetical protein